jgi:VWFA-related protein
VSEILDNVIGGADLVGLMTPELPARNLPLTRKTEAIARMVRDMRTWNARDRVNTTDPRERELETCYPDGDPLRPQLRGVAKELIERRREQTTLRALDDLVEHMGTLRDGRKFVILLTEGWAQFRQSDRLGGALLPSTPAVSTPGVGTDGRITTTDEQPTGGNATALDSCERERVMLSFIDHSVQLRELAQRANRANVTFYAIDPRGLTPFDDSIGPLRPAMPADDRARLSARQTGLRELAEQTDGGVVLSTNDVRGGTARMLADLDSYYLMSYYSANPKMDGRFRRLRVEVKRGGVEVRARPGYLAPTETEARAAGMAPAGPASTVPPIVTRALESIAPGRGNLPVRLQAAGGFGSVRAVVELDAATARRPEWASGGVLRVTLEPERSAAPASPVIAPITLDVAPGTRSIPIERLGDQLPAGTYTVKAELTPRTGRVPVQATAIVTLQAAGARVGSGVLALRRGPSTGLAYVPTADPRYRRTERLRVEVPVAGAPATATGRVLTREGTAMPLVVSYSEREGAAPYGRFGVADLMLAPLAQGEYVLELTFSTGAVPAIVAYGFRIVP